MAKFSENPITSSDINWNEVDPENGLQWSGKSIREFQQRKNKETENNTATKIACSYFDSNTMTLYHFANEEDKEAWLSSKDNIYILEKVTFNFAGTVQQLKVVNQMSSGILYYTTKATEAIITCSFISQEKGIADSAWTDVNEDFEVSVAVDKGNTGSFTTIISNTQVLNGNSFSFDIRNSISTGSNRVRVTAKGIESGASGSFVYTVNLTTMYLSPSNFSWYLPFVEGNTYNLGGMNIGGNLQKVLRVRVTREETYLKDYEVNIGDAIYTSTAYVFKGLEFPTAGTGVYNVDIWLDANGLTSEHLNYNIICVAKADEKVAQLVSVSESPETVMNFAENKLFDYCIYNGGMTVGSPEIKLDTIVNTNKTNLKTETLVNVPTGQALSYTTALEIEVVEAKMQLSATMDYGNSQQVIYPVDNSKSYPATSETVFYLNPAQRSNAQGDKEQIINSINSVHYNADWTRMAWVDGMDGWTKDDAGRMCLRIPALSKCVIDHKPMSDIRTPITLEFVYKIANASDYDEPIITIADNLTNEDGTYNPNFRGIKITPKNITLHSRNLTNSRVQDYNTVENEVLDIIITIVPNYKTNYGNLAQVYCNGVKVRSFEFTSITEWNTQANIILGSNTADLFLYKMKVYHKGFDKTDAMRNFINSLPDLVSREMLYNRLTSVTDDSFNLDYDTCVKNGYNTMIIEMLNGKNIPSLQNQESGLLCNLQINVHNIVENELDEEMEALLTGTPILSQVIEGQGTTAMTYNRWNFRWKLDSNYGKRRITAKKNFASSMQSHKMGSTRIFNYLHSECVGANEVGGKIAVLQYPVFGFQKVLQDDGKTYKYQPIGLYTIGADKGDKKTFGFDNKTYKNTIMHMEGADHTPKTVGFDYPWEYTKFVGKSEAMGAIQAGGTIIGAWEVGMAGDFDTDTTEDEGNVQAMLDSEFKGAYNVAYFNSPFILGTSEDLTKVDVDTWQTQVDAEGNSYSSLEFWNTSTYDLYFYNQATKKYEKTGINMLTDLGLTSSNVSGKSIEEINNLFVEKRCERFVRDWGNYWHEDDTIFHYTFCLILGATDNFKKNTYPYKFKPIAEGGRWRWRGDDLDTIFDINNQGLAAKSYSVLVGDKTDTGSGSVFRGDNSALWTLIKITQKDRIKAMVHKMFDAMVSHPLAQGSSTQEKLVGAIKYFYWDFAQEYFPESAYNIDTEWSYEDTWSNKNAWKEVNPLSQALGGHYEAERDWVTMRMLFCASYYNYGAFTAEGYKDASTGQMVYGGADAHTYEFTPAIDMNPTIVRGSTETITYGDRVKANETVPLTVSSSTGADTRIYVQGLDWVKDIGDLSNLTVSADNPTLNIASKRLQRVKIGDEDASKLPPSATIQSITFGDCPSMTSVDARNLSTLTGTVDLTTLPRLREAYFEGTDVKVLKIQDGSKIEKLQIPDSLTELRLKDLKFLAGSSKVNLDFYETRSWGLGSNRWYKDGSKGQHKAIPIKPGNTYVIKGTINPGQSGSSVYMGFLTSSYVQPTSNLSIPFAGGKKERTVLTSGTENTLIAPSDAKYLIITVVDGAGVTSTWEIQDLNASFVYKSLSNISSFHIENCPTIDGFYLLREAYNDPSSALSQIRLVGFDQTGDSSDLSMLSNMVNDLNFKGEYQIFTGIGSEGQVTDHPVLEGTVHITTPVYRHEEELLRNSYGNAFVMDLVGGYYVKFADPEVQKVCANKWGDKLGTTEAQIKAITDIGQTFRANTAIQTFNEFEEFTNVKTITYAFNGCTGLKEIKFPEGLTKISGYSADSGGCFQNCTALEEVVLPVGLIQLANAYNFSGCTNLKKVNLDLPYLTTIGYGTFNKCPNLIIEDINLPSLTSIGQISFYSGTQVKKITSLGEITTLPTLWDEQGIFMNNTLLTEVTLPNTLITIGGCTFLGCSGIEHIDIPDSVTTIGYRAFENCTGLKTINFGSGITSISRRGFYNCSSLVIEDLLLPNLTSINLDSFYGVNIKKISNLGNITSLPAIFGESDNKTSIELEEVILPESLTSVAYRTFSGLQNLKTVTFQSANANLDRCFYRSSLESITLPYENTELYSTVFYYCTSLQIVNNLSSITKMSGEETFYNCTSLEIEDLALPNLENFGRRSFHGVKIHKISDLGKITALPYAAEGDQNYGNKELLIEVTLPETLSSVPANSFYGYVNLNNISLGAITSLGDQAFRGCTSLQTVDLGNLQTVGSSAFYNCTSLQTVDLGNLQTVGSSAFYNCTLDLEDLSNVQTINGFAFHNTTISTVNLPNLTTVSAGAFYNCKSLTEVLDLGEITVLPYANSAPNGLGWGHRGVFSECENLTKVVLPETLKEIQRHTFRTAKLGNNLNLPESIEILDAYALADIGLTLEEVYLPNLISIGAGAFVKNDIKKVTNLGHISVLSSGNASEGYFSGLADYGVFRACTKLESIILPDSLVEIGTSSFQDCTSLSEVTISPDSSLTTISTNAFLGCTSLSDIYFPDSLITIGQRAFESTSLDGVVVKAKNVTTLGNGCFRYSSLRGIILPSIEIINSTGSYAYYTFYSCTKLEYALFGNSLTKIADNAFNGCSNLKELILLSETPPTLSAAIPSQTTIYVPDASVEAYKTASGWSSYATRIKDISSLPIDNPSLYEEVKEYLVGYVADFIFGPVDRITFLPTLQLYTYYLGETIQPQYTIQGSATVDENGLLTFSEEDIVTVTATYEGYSISRVYTYYDAITEEALTVDNLDYYPNSGNKRWSFRIPDQDLSSNFICIVEVLAGSPINAGCAVGSNYNSWDKHYDLFDSSWVSPGKSYTFTKSMYSRNDGILSISFKRVSGSIDITVEEIKQWIRFKYYEEHVLTLVDNSFSGGGIAENPTQLICKYSGEVITPQWSVVGDATIDENGLLNFNNYCTVTVTATYTYRDMSISKDYTYMEIAIVHGVELTNSGTTTENSTMSTVGPVSTKGASSIKWGVIGGTNGRMCEYREDGTCVDFWGGGTNPRAVTINPNSTQVKASFSSAHLADAYIMNADTGEYLWKGGEGN